MLALPFPVGAAGVRGAAFSLSPAMVSRTLISGPVSFFRSLARMGLGVQSMKSSGGEARRRRWGPKVCVCGWDVGSNALRQPS